MSKPQNQNFVLGAGYVRIAEWTSDTLPRGRRYMGDTPSLSLGASDESVPKYGSDGRTAEILEHGTARVDRTGSFQCDNIVPANLALFYMAAASTVSQSSGSKTETLTVQTGLWYQLGVTASNPAGARKVTSVTGTIDPGGSATSTTPGTDFTVDEETGMVYVEPGGAISDGDSVEWAWDEAQADFDQVATNNLGPKTVLLHFQGDNTEGEDRDVLIPRCQLTPNGDMAWKSRDTWQNMQFNIRFEKAAGYEQLYINGRPA